MKYTFVLILILQSCTLRVGPSIKQINLKEAHFSDVPVVSNLKEKRNFESKECAKIYFIIPNKVKMNFEELLKNSCNEDEVLIDSQLYDTFYYIPPIYGEECLTLKGKCAKI